MSEVPHFIQVQFRQLVCKYPHIQNMGVWYFNFLPVSTVASAPGLGI